jgi:hypothetical protein
MKTKETITASALVLAWCDVNKKYGTGMKLPPPKKQK